MNIQPEREAEESMETDEDDSLEDLVNDVMPSPSKEVLCSSLASVLLYWSRGILVNF